ncbi:hypothetical protein INS49_012741 [Diaporthe citri]|uniref:uncharacterized protein n=1 Tax=Diaporthe citri TaxID=83186 RepID=UPI001C7E27BC|nr:uncharacterized protein INS49_012741 [Diaporthe citri]KAG6359220.1 hypothetical protein INS49_012741 [Diaporthe citri]
MSRPPVKSPTPSKATIAAPSRSQRAQRSDHHAATAATPPPQRRNQRHRPQRLRAHLASPVDLAHCDIPVVLCCLASGLCDASAFAAWGCFVSMQTGNSVFLCLGASRLPAGGEPYGWAKSLISIAAFVAGSLCWAQASRRAGPTRRATLAGSFAVQVAFTAVAAALVQAGVVPSSNSNGNSSGPGRDSQEFLERVPVALLAFQSAGQLSTAQLVGVGEVPTVVLTSVYYGLAADAGFFRGRNVHRDRRIAGVIAFFAGAISGGWLERSRGGIAAALWISAAVKLGIAVSWLFWKAEKTGDG